MSLTDVIVTYKNKLETFDVHFQFVLYKRIRVKILFLTIIHISISTPLTFCVSYIDIDNKT